ncbi:ADP-ribosylglycohydrolase family protein [Xenorhabdus innexi]|uniref:ADP-ribosyl-glycohydrolase n=1 Tax=Xenorhabdus innexi TaxID=290109 RepID=A0A1N6MU71_9GAMM|nr:ADP-ribosylglycohydrolase family protein [Xenorhabdus innexi]PHM36462.1 ADP-ribosyl- glycohydrolase [Xenorhabdus innexi]SIP72415.1 putative ADP-ribosylation/Crystallin J1 [Xenorhabdus innexi]
MNLPSHTQKIVNSALWAAVGDALGWISELVDSNGLKRRIKRSSLQMPTSWERKIGGYSGVNVHLPSGTYSDDTQLRLAVSRSIRSNGQFDIESFAKIELPVWLSYALGAGRASKVAAKNLVKKDTNWFSNFYDSKSIKYTESGGNGTAMRIQPHVWSCINLEKKEYIMSVVMDSIVTHGHLLAICGAIFHANALQFSLINGRAANFSEMKYFIDDFSLINDAINNNYELKNFWLPTWEQTSGKRLYSEIIRIKEETVDYLDLVINTLPSSGKLDQVFSFIINKLDCDKEQRRGASTNTALASSILSHLCHKSDPYKTMLICVNQLGTDTDTIASMAGAIIGCYNDAPTWDIQDKSYIIQEAIRLSNISFRKNEKYFSYPDLNKWNAPQTQSDALGINDADLVVKGLGKAEPINNQIWENKTHNWRWVKLEFGQTILIKSKNSKLELISLDQIPDAKFSQLDLNINKNQINLSDTILSKQDDLFSSNIEKKQISAFNNVENYNEEELDLDKITSKIIKNGFNYEEIGRFLIEFASEKNLESCIAYAAIIGKAFNVRKK